MTDDEWAAIAHPLRVAILEHYGMTTKQLNIRLPYSSHDLLTALMEQTGMTQVQVIIVALEHLALVKGVTPPPSSDAPPAPQGKRRKDEGG